MQFRGYSTGLNLDIFQLNVFVMKDELKPGSTIEHEGKQWIVTEVSEDNEGQVVYHLKSGDEVSVIKESELPVDTE